MNKIMNQLFAPVLCALALLAPASPALADSPHQRFVVFGDSLSDPGNAFVLLRKLEVPPFDNLIPDAPYARGAAHFSNGATWIEQLSLRERAVPSAGPALLIPRVFSNYAVGGSTAAPLSPFDLSRQVSAFLNDFGANAPGNALYVIWLGGNDIRAALGALAQDPTGATSEGILKQAIEAIGINLHTLHFAGARKFLVANAPDLALTPAVRKLGEQAQGAANLFSQQFNLGLERTLQGVEARLDVEIVRLDVFGILNEVVAAPQTFGLSNVTGACIRLNVTAGAFCRQPGSYLFWDGIHPTAAGHRILARRANAALDNAPVLAQQP
jgi:phospholipase/lecithinase/hemolysin